MAADVLMMGVFTEPRLGFDGVDSTEMLEKRECFVEVKAGSGGFAPFTVCLMAWPTSERKASVAGFEDARAVMSNA